MLTEKSGDDVSRELLLKAAEALKETMEFTVGKLRARKVRDSDKLRFMRALTKEVEAVARLVGALRDLNAKEKEVNDWAVYLSEVKKRVPSKFVTKKFSRVFRRLDAGGAEYRVLHRRRRVRRATGKTSK